MTTPDPFAYPPEPHLRKHGPAGYKNYSEFKPWLRDEFEFRCAYCLQREMWSRDRHAAFSVDHLVPQVEGEDLICDYRNLVYACLRCNALKQDVRALDPTREGMGRHLRIEPAGAVSGLTEDGRFLIGLLHLNAASAVSERRRILRLLKLRQRYPADPDIEEDYRTAFRYPEDLPDLRLLKPPQGNALDANKLQCFCARREKGDLPQLY
ncbi:MAG TPA: HNH endonuclease [Gemmataceae bacterium]|nr:HNH endonuclease [Gemmataceae bacterium]